MLQGRTLPTLAAEVDRQAKAKRDFLAPTDKMELHGDAGFNLRGVGRFNPTRHFHGQLGEYLGIPSRYYDLCLDKAPALLAQNVNHWLVVRAARENDKRMVRTLDGAARAFLSDRFRPLDNYDLLTAVLPAVQGQAGLRVESCEVTETRLYLKVVNERVQAEVKPGDVVQAGVMVCNSEVGMGALTVQPLVFRLACINGVIMSDSTLRKYHAGDRRGRGNNGEDVIPYDVLSDEARRASDKALWLSVRDLTKAALSEALFTKGVNAMRAAAGQPMEAPLSDVLDVTKRRFGLRDTEGEEIIRQLVLGGDLSRYGLVNAVTRAAQEVKDYDRSTELERVGGEILELPPSEWAVLSRASA